MAEGKNSFVLYTEIIHTVEKMPDEKAGQLFKHILRYVNDQNPETDDLVIQLTFEPIKHQLKRALKAWNNRADASRENGKKGGRPKNLTEPDITQENPTGFLQTQENLTEPEKPVSVPVPVSVNVSEPILLKKESKSKKINKKKVQLFEGDIDSRKTQFTDSAYEHIRTHPKEMIDAFIRYWCEPTLDVSKMRFEIVIEKNKTWSMAGRLATWKQNNFGNNGKPAKQSTDDAIRSFISQG